MVHDIVYWTTMDQTVRRGDDLFTTTDGYHVTQDPADQGPNGDENEWSTSAGSDPTAGTWEFEIHEISYLARGATEPVLAQGSLEVRGGHPVGDQVGFLEQS